MLDTRLHRPILNPPPQSPWVSQDTMADGFESAVPLFSISDSELKTNEAPDSSRRTPGRLFAKWGSPHNSTDLASLNLAQAKNVIVFSNHTADRYDIPEIAADFEAIATFFALKKHIQSSKVLIELRSASHVRFLAQDSSSNVSSFKQQQAEQFGAEGIPQLNLADGNVYVRGSLDALLAQSYFNPHAQSLMKALVLGTFHPRKNIVAADIEQPDGSIDPQKVWKTGLQLIPLKQTGRDKYMCFGTMFKHCLDNKEWIIVGLRRFDQTTKRHYVITNPPDHFELQADDGIYVILSVEKHRANLAKQIQAASVIQRHILSSSSSSSSSNHHGHHETVVVPKEV